MPTPFAPWLAAKASRREKFVPSVRWARLCLEVLEDRSAPGSLAALFGLDGISPFPDNTPLPDGSTTDAPAFRTADSSAASSVSPRDQALSQGIFPSIQGQGSGQGGGSSAQQSSGSTAAPLAAPSPDENALLTANLPPSLFDPFAATPGTQSQPDASVNAAPTAPTAAQPPGNSGSSQGPASPPAASPPPAATPPPIAPPGSSSASQAPPVTALTPAQQAASAINQTGVDLFLRLAQENPGANLSLSPSSLSTALAMLYGGARGQTAAQMAQVLNFLPEGDSIHADFAALLQTLNAESNSQDQLSVANALWVQQGYPLQPDFVQLLQNDYGSGVGQEDFVGATEQARQAINSWVSQQTDGKITDLIPPGAVDSSTRLVLTNAVYFNAAWSEPFNPNLTNQQTFHVAPGQDVETKMMHQTGSFGYYDGGDFTALSMDYQGGNQSMVILLPNQADGLAGFEQTLTANQLTNVVSQMQQQQVAVSLPRFQVQQSLNLNDELSGMGMPLAFSNHADFSGINDGGDPLKVSQVLQKVFVQVGEQGTQAAAATGVVLADLAFVFQPQPPVTFQANHPFVYLIRDNSTGAILFMGQVTNPT